MAITRLAAALLCTAAMTAGAQSLEPGQFTEMMSWVRKLAQIEERTL